jgi:hypothetical protein
MVVELVSHLMIRRNLRRLKPKWKLRIPSLNRLGIMWYLTTKLKLRLKVRTNALHTPLSAVAVIGNKTVANAL